MALATEILPSDEVHDAGSIGSTSALKAPPSGPQKSRPTEALFPILLGALGMIIAFYPMLFSRFERVQSDPGDARFIYFTLEYEYRSLRGDRFAHDFWSPGIFFPERNTLAYSDLFVSLQPFYSPWRMLGAEPDTAFQFLMLITAALNFLAAYLVFRTALGRSSLASSFGAFLFSFGSIRLNQLNHAQLLPQFYVLISFYALVRILKADAAASSKQFLWWLSLFFGGISAQLYADYYHGWFYLFALGLCCVWGLIKSETRPKLLRLLRSKWKWLMIGALAWVVSVAPLGLHYWRAAQRVGLRDFGQAKGMLPRFQSWFYVGSENWLWGWLSRWRLFETLPMRWEHRLGLGLVTTGIFVYILWRARQSPLIRVFTFLSVAVIVLSTVYRGQLSPWALVFHAIPGANAIRAVSRIGFLLLLPASYALACFVELSLSHRMRGLLLSICGVSLLEQGRAQFSYDKQVIRQEVESVVRRVEPGHCGAFYYSPWETSNPAYLFQLDAMFAYLATGLPTVNGYSGNAPRDWKLEDSRIGSAADELRLAQRLDSWARSQGISSSTLCWIKPHL